MTSSSNQDNLIFIKVRSAAHLRDRSMTATDLSMDWVALRAMTRLPVCGVCEGGRVRERKGIGV